MFRIDDNFVKPFLPKPTPQPEVNKPPAQPQNDNLSAKKADAQFVGASNKAKLERQFAADKPTPFKVLEQIYKLPKPDPADTAAVRAYKEQRQEIADHAIKNSQPPKMEDYRNFGLNGATASYEYREASANYNSQIGDLKKVSADAKTYPDKILTPGEAVNEINNLPRPDRNNPQAIVDYNNRRAAVADSALMFAEPPTRGDFKGLNGATANDEFQQAKSDYNSAVSQLNEASNSRYSATPPPLTDAEADTAAQYLINKNGGATDEDQAFAVGKEVAALAETDPEAAAAVMKKVQEKLNDTERGDNVADGFVTALSDADLAALNRADGGREMLENLKNYLLTGNVHDNEKEDARRIDFALYPQLNNVQGAADRVTDADSGRNGRVLAEELGKLDSEGQTALMNELAARDPQSFKAILYQAGEENYMLKESGYQLSEDEQKTIANALSEAYAAKMLPTDADGNDTATLLSYALGREASQAIGNLLGEADSVNSRQLKAAFAREALAAAGDDDYFGSPYDAAAGALRAIANDPAAIAEVLKPYQTGKVNDQSLSDILKMADEAGFSGGLPSVTAQFLDGAKLLPSGENNLKMDIFRACVRDLPDAFDGEFNSDKADALGRFFSSSKEFLTTTMNNADATLEDMKTFSRFTELTMFNKDCTEGENVRNAIADIAGSLRAEALKYNPNKTGTGNEQTLSAARTLGTLTGNLFNGYFLRVEDIQKADEENKAFLTGLVDMALDFIPMGDLVKNLGASQILEKIADKGISLTKEQLSASIVDTIFSGDEADTVQQLQDFVQKVLVNLPDGEAKEEAVQSQRGALGLFGVYDLLGG